MIGSIKHCVVLAAVLLSGCVTYSQNELPPVQTWPPTANAPQQKPKVFVRTTVMNQVNGGPANTAAGAAAAVGEATVAEGFRESGRFAWVSTDKAEADLYVEATWLNKSVPFSVVSELARKAPSLGFSK